MSRLLSALVDAAQRHALVIVIAAVALAAGLGHWTARHLSIDTDLANLIAPDLPWRQAEIEMARQFPKLGKTLVVVIEGGSDARRVAAQQALVAALRSRSDAFHDVFAIDTEPYFRRNGLLFLEPDALQALADRLIAAQPFLGALDADPSLSGLFLLLERALDAPAGTDFDLRPAFDAIAAATRAAATGARAPLDWNALLGDADSAALAGSRRFIELDAVRDYTQMVPALLPMTAVREAIATLGPTADGLTIRVTGTVAMEHEELLTAFEGAGIAMFLAIGISALLLWFALQSLRLMLATVLSLAFGLLLTAAFAAFAVGHLNLISVAFGVLYIGLGLDYALYLGMQYRERLGRGTPPKQALGVAAGDVGGYMVVCALTTALGFFAFVPTDFLGIAELGVISGAGMLISLIVTVLLLPALVAVLRPDAARIAWRPTLGSRLSRLLAWPYAHARPIWIVAAGLALAAAFVVPQARFDSDPLKLRDPSTEAIRTFRDLLRDPDVPTLTMSALAPDLDTAQRLAAALGERPEVRRALSLGAFVPTAQDDKLAILDELRFALGPQLADGPAPTAVRAAADDIVRLQQFQVRLGLWSAAQADASTAASGRALADALAVWLAAYAQREPAARALLLARLRGALLDDLLPKLAQLKTALSAQPVTVADLPPALVERWKSADGLYRVEALPAERLDDAAAEHRFIDAVQAIAPAATGAPSTQREAGAAIVGSFQQAFGYSAIAITLLLIVLLRSLIDTVLVLLPLALAGLLTIAASVLAGVPFNFANVIALPLILGVGVDYGVYLVQRGREAADGSLLRTGTARAVLFGALITLVNFGNLAFAKHPGMVSMGLLLTLGLAMTLACALVLLPSLLVLRWRSRESAMGTGES